MRLGRVEGLDLNLFEFDCDLTFTVFFLRADDKVYARYGGRDARDADGRQSLPGLRHTMQSVLQMHARKEPRFAPRTDPRPLTTRDLAGGRGRRCLHCHNVKERLNQALVASGDWKRDFAYRYPLPDNLGLRLAVDRGNVVERVAPGSPAARAGLTRGDVLRRLGAVPVHSLADAQFALDKAPASGALKATWERDGRERTGEVALPPGWRKSDVTWRASMRRRVPAVPVAGADLGAAEKKALGLPEKALAFRQREQVTARAREAGVRPGDVILGIEGEPAGPTADEFRDHVRRDRLVGDTITLTVLREGKRLRVPITLAAR